MKKVRDTKAGQAISCYAVVDKKGNLVSKVHVYYSESGSVTVNAMNMNPEYGPSFQESKAGGFGYDKFTSALSGMTIAGHYISDHCEMSLYHKRGYFLKSDKLKKGYSLANYGLFDPETGKEVSKIVKDCPSAISGFKNAFRESGLDILKYYGFNVIQVL